MTPHNLNILLGLSTVGFVVVSLLYMIQLTSNTTAMGQPTLFVLSTAKSCAVPHSSDQSRTP